MAAQDYNPAPIIASARSLLADAATRCHAPDRISEANVHEIRKTLKKVRAYWRLMRFALGKRHSKAGNERCKQAARQFAHARDHVVMLSTLDELGQQTGTKTTLALGQAKQAMHHAGGTVTGDIDWDHAADLIRNDDAAWSGLNPQQINPADIKRAWKRTRRKARKGYQQSRSNPHPQALHDWRKWVKRRLQQEELLHRDKHDRIATLEELGDLLGRHHDLAVLSDRLWRNDRFGGKPQKRVRKSIHKQQAELAKQARKLGKQVCT